MLSVPTYLLSFFFNDTATTEIYTLSLHDALPILSTCGKHRMRKSNRRTLDFEDLQFFSSLDDRRDPWPKSKVHQLDGWNCESSRSKEHFPHFRTHAPKPGVRQFHKTCGNTGLLR